MNQHIHPFQSVRFTLLALLAGVLVLTLVVVGTGSFQLVAAAERELWHGRQEAIARSAGQTVGDFLHTTGEVLLALSAADAKHLAGESELTSALLAGSVRSQCSMVSPSFGVGNIPVLRVTVWPGSGENSTSKDLDAGTGGELKS